ncbi:6694_t:CDS:2 [Paraglomus occultum]|uniref:6694_t:CDS:1 n=1 Tax=Paraglomus occultum TaxID=144539 RepID=A0A9N9BH25_9GLOM|nr:6694_t:CDS:2 [Paraglomus occultum]
MADSETTPLAQNTTSTPLADAEKGSTSRVASVGTTSHNSASAGSSNSRKALRVEEANVQQKRSPPPKSQVPVKSFEDWQNDTISKVLRITLDKSAAEKSSHVLIYLNTLVDELKEEYPENASGKFKLSQSLLDRALFARLSLDPNGMSDNDDTTIAIASLPDVPLFDYLVDCWKSVADVKKNVLAREKILDPAVLNQRIEVLDKVKGLVVSYAGLILQSPEMFPQVKTSVPLGSQQLLPKLLAETDTEEGLPLEFIKDLAIRFENDEFEEASSDLTKQEYEDITGIG